MENQTSFDLNGAIRRWRGELEKSASFRSDDLEELEAHLRDSESSLRARGLTAEEAFLIAVRRTGSGDVLAAEFASINGPSIWLDHLLWMITGSITISTLWSLTTTLVVLRTALAGGLAFALIVGLHVVLVRKFLTQPRKLAIAFLLVSLSSVFVRTAFMGRAFYPAADMPYMQRLLLYNWSVFFQFAAMITLFLFKGRKQRPA